ncbi:hypothetical protein DFS34DRAFT_645105 [Phlyctochytrium arcticum]|nr:hypothetical protein DFS34DRAFT_645105 [Phlyctochytrium arcticum]
MGDSPGKPRLVIQLAESLENQPHPDWLNMTQAMAECVRLCPLGNPNNYDWIRTNKKSQALCIQFDFNMLDDEPVPATSFADPECLWAELGRAPSYPILYGLDRNRVPPTEFEENLPFGTVVAIQAMLTTWDFPARKAEPASHLVRTMSITTIKILAKARDNVVHGTDAHAVEAGEALNDL